MQNSGSDPLQLVRVWYAQCMTDQIIDLCYTLGMIGLPLDYHSYALGGGGGGGGIIALSFNRILVLNPNL